MMKQKNQNITAPAMAMLVLLTTLLVACNTLEQPENMSPGQPGNISPSEIDPTASPVTLPMQTAQNDLMKSVSLTTSALELYHYNGEITCSSISFDINNNQNILAELNAVIAREVKDWSPNDITLPIYGLKTAAADGSSVFVAWSNNFWIAQDGTVYVFDFDFNRIKENYTWSKTNEYTGFFAFPCERFLTQDANGWNTKLLTPARETNTPPADLTMELISWHNEIVTVNFRNNSSDDWSYGEGFFLQVLLDGVWYEVPFFPGSWGFLAVGHIVRSGEEREQTYNLAIYGELPPGKYRLVSYGMYRYMLSETHSLTDEYDLSVECVLS